MKIENNDSILVISEDVGTLLEQKRISQEAQAEFYKQQQSEKQEVANDGYFYDQNEQEVESQSERSKQDCVNDQEEDAESVEESYPNSKEMEKMRQLL